MTRYIVRHWERVLVPANIYYSTRRTASERILRLTLTHDSNDANDSNLAIEKNRHSRHNRHAGQRNPDSPGHPVKGCPGG